MKKNIWKNFTSRKFICCFIVTIVGIITLFIGENEIVNVVASATMTILPAIVYCIIEGKIDAVSVKQITEATADAAEKLGVDEQIVDIIEKIGDAAEGYVGEHNPPVDDDTEK